MLNDRPILFAGHQPRLFHPGVWYKNFRLYYVAKQFEATSINMVVDNDLAVSSLIKLPTFEASVGGSPQVRTSFVAVDDPGPAVPFEMLGVQNETAFPKFRRSCGRSDQPDRGTSVSKGAMARSIGRDG